jgi:hypothetical protein
LWQNGHHDLAALQLTVPRKFRLPGANLSGVNVQDVYGCADNPEQTSLGPKLPVNREFTGKSSSFGQSRGDRPNLQDCFQRLTENSSRNTNREHSSEIRERIAVNREVLVETTTDLEIACAVSDDLFF